MVKLYGASGHCKVIIDIIISIGFSIDKIYDDTENIKQLLNYPVTHTSKITNNIGDLFIISIGNNKVRKIISEKYNFRFGIFIHEKSIISKSAYIDEGTVVMPGAVVNSNAKIGKHCIINTSSVIEHDCTILNFVHICPNVSLAGDVIIDEGTQVGIGAIIIQGVKIGKWAIIGAGAVIINDVPDFAVVVGNPGKIIKLSQPT
ncbi:MAG TPA: acetyltransferase [Flavobacterium sp.]|nr:acetyltransferase [Flavobacterium sp.]